MGVYLYQSWPTGGATQPRENGEFVDTRKNRQTGESRRRCHVMGDIENGEFVDTGKNRQTGESCRLCHVMGDIENGEFVDTQKNRKKRRVLPTM